MTATAKTPHNKHAADARFHVPLPKQVLATRKDMPVAQFAIRGSVAAALAAISTPEGRSAAEETYRREKFSATAPGPRSAASNTCLKFHDCWFRGEVDPRPLTADKVAGVLTCFKAGRYFSIGNYITVAWQARVRAGFTITDQIHLDMTAGRRSVTRSKAPPHQSAELPARLLPLLDFPDIPESPQDII